MSAPNTTPGLDAIIEAWRKCAELDRADELKRNAAPELYEALNAVVRTMDGYRSQMKFCDIEALGYFREFDRRIEASGMRAALAKARGEA